METRKKVTKKYREKNKEKIKISYKKWAINNKDKKNAINRAYRTNNKDKVRIWMKKARKKQLKKPLTQYKELVRTLTRLAVKIGKILKPSCCEYEDCFDSKIQIHHLNYDNHMDIKWLCYKHHLITHGKILHLRD